MLIQVNSVTASSRIIYVDVTLENGMVAGSVVCGAAYKQPPRKPRRFDGTEGRRKCATLTLHLMQGVLRCIR